MQKINNNQPKLNIDVSKTLPVKCEKCGSEYFEMALWLRRIPKLLIGAQADQLYPVPVYKCANCNHVNKEFEPQIIGGN